ncbi:LYR motif-containing protein 4-like [Portunus trituberculatus]|uniref:LYR motif-containing protein 4-like n=1 Tax=Portunus trituberculatus TaxID=210409 RepID=UPI001E1CDBD9|nr:LYR motif-containing protein 4-like [Portunus trituberculatus]
MAAGGRQEALALYKALLRESGKFTSYNYREYALRRVRDGFRKAKSLTTEADQKRELEMAKESLQVIKRQVVIGNLYRSPALVIEK